jgi:hypothetical protein
MEAFLQRTGADELMFDHAARLRCYEIVAALEPDPAAGPAPVAYPTRLDT